MINLNKELRKDKHPIRSFVLPNLYMAASIADFLESCEEVKPTPTLRLILSNPYKYPPGSAGIYLRQVEIESVDESLRSVSISDKTGSVVAINCLGSSINQSFVGPKHITDGTYNLVMLSYYPGSDDLDLQFIHKPEDFTFNL